jgi:hypothetical protein
VLKKPWVGHFERPKSLLIIVLSTGVGYDLAAAGSKVENFDFCGCPIFLTISSAFAVNPTTVDPTGAPVNLTAAPGGLELDKITALSLIQRRALVGYPSPRRFTVCRRQTVRFQDPGTDNVDHSARHVHWQPKHNPFAVGQTAGEDGSIDIEAKAQDGDEIITYTVNGVEVQLRVHVIDCGRG